MCTQRVDASLNSRVSLEHCQQALTKVHKLLELAIAVIYVDAHLLEWLHGKVFGSSFFIVAFTVAGVSFRVSRVLTVLDTKATSHPFQTLFPFFGKGRLITPSKLALSNNWHCGLNQ